MPRSHILAAALSLSLLAVPLSAQQLASSSPSKPAAASPPSTPAAADGLHDRTTWEAWYSGLSGDYQAGAQYWAAHRSKPTEAVCRGAGEWQQGCTAARQQLATYDARRRNEPDYKAGWNAYQFEPGQTTPPEMTSRDPAGTVVSNHGGLASPRADRMAQLLAFRAVRGDATALESLERDADSGVASAETGLAEYYYRMRSKLGPSYSVDMILDVTSTFNNSAKHAMDWALERDRRSPQSSLAQQDEYTRKIHRLLKDAASKNDAAAMGALGQAIVVEFWNLEITTERMGLKLADDSGTVAAARQLCPQAKSMLEAADEAGWAPAAAQLGLMHGSNAPDTLLVATGCMFPTNIRQSDKYFERSAEEGDPASLKMMVIQMQKAGNAVATEKWLRRLKAITQYGDPDAAAVLRALGRS